MVSGSAINSVESPGTGDSMGGEAPVSTIRAGMWVRLERLCRRTGRIVGITYLSPGPVRGSWGSQVENVSRYEWLTLRHGNKPERGTTERAHRKGELGLQRGLVEYPGNGGKTGGQAPESGPLQG